MGAEINSLREPASDMGVNSQTPMNSHFASVGDTNGDFSYEHGIQIIDEKQNFNASLAQYIKHEGLAHAGFDYHLISVFGSQSTGKSTLLNSLFGTDFGVMSEVRRQQTTKGIWMAKNKNNAGGLQDHVMANNILVMDVEGTDGRERGEDQDFERKSALFALATSEVLIVNIWEHQVGLYQGANMGLLKIVFEVNLELFLKGMDKSAISKSLLFFVIRDHIGNTPMKNLQATLMADLSRIWSSLNKPTGLEESVIEDYFDFGFAALPHKILQPENFQNEVDRLKTRFVSESYVSNEPPLLLAKYHRKIPADGLAIYAEGIWAQIIANKDLDLPSQQELLAQYRCDEIMREVMSAFDAEIVPLETRYSAAADQGSNETVANFGQIIKSNRDIALNTFTQEAGRYNKSVFERKCAELEDSLDIRLQVICGKHLSFIRDALSSKFTQGVGNDIRSHQMAAKPYDFGLIVKTHHADVRAIYESELVALHIDGAPWSSFQADGLAFEKNLTATTSKLRADELKRLSTRIERLTQSGIADLISKLFSDLENSCINRPSATSTKEVRSSFSFWERLWTSFVQLTQISQEQFTDNARSFQAATFEVEQGLFKIRWQAWVHLHAKLSEELSDGNLLGRAREIFETKFRYDEHDVPRIWKPTDDIERVYSKARDEVLTLITMLSTFVLEQPDISPDLVQYIGPFPAKYVPEDENLGLIEGLSPSSQRSWREEMVFINDSRARDMTQRFRKAADALYVEAKRSAVRATTSIPLYFYGLLLALGWNEIVAVLRNPLYFVFLILLGAAAYILHTLNLWSPLYNMSIAALSQATEELKVRLREFLESSESGRQMMGRPSETEKPIEMQATSKEMENRDSQASD